MVEDYENPGPTRDEVDASRGPLVLEFGTGWCGYCALACGSAEAACAACACSACCSAMARSA